MKTKSGWLEMVKKERKEIETVLEHCERDISYDAGGTFAKNPGTDDEVDVREVEKAKKGIAFIRWILSTYLD